MPRVDAPKQSLIEEQVPDDVMHLINLANFNGLCRVIAALAQNGLLAPDQVDNIEDCMTAPLDDPEWRDHESMASTRDILEGVLARAMRDSRRGSHLEADPEP
jgi:hypothetical protein